jgi:hypothetical protein
MHIISRTFRVQANGMARCVKCDMRMVVAAGFDLEPEQMTFECLQCGHVEKPEARDEQHGRSATG